MKTSVLLVLSLTATIRLSAFAPAPKTLREVLSKASHLFAEEAKRKKVSFDLRT
jgi:hypothetical protein